ncbi:kinase-like protein [Plenodomus tracheiphilus IPT5]|uniref:non-specific serine/threonine protein kinase n=1 Tax=Plenodomus tracheiphilus IPT5 TaxID=1408161 RepID=A0A6A7AVE1_9PLEO|nr:kinase-like protein [Plenodomus tracheiphilus IPT5]
MAAPPRPNTLEQNGETIYESLDDVDEQLYNSITTLYQRAAFIDIIDKWRKDLALGVAGPLVTGEDIRELWQRKMNYWSKKRKNKPMVNRPRNLASPPVPTTTVNPPAAAPDTLAPITPAPVTPAAYAHRNPPLSGERSPVFRQDREWTDTFAPTFGQRNHMFNKAGGGPWKFARVIASNLDPAGWKANWLLVRVSATNTIDARIVAKWMAPGLDDPQAAQVEIDINELLAPIGCAHILPWRGYSTRTKRKRIIGEEMVSQREYFMYSDFAPLGTLRNVINAHQVMRPDGSRKQVSEHFIWYVLGELAKALLAMRTGRCQSPIERREPADPVRSPWHQILHNDIKDINIMLQEGNVRYPTYPRVLLFDFGLSRTEQPGGGHERVEGTIIWSPPERTYTEEPEHYPPSRWLVTEKSDIWSVGLAAWQLMQATRGVDAFDQFLADKHDTLVTNELYTPENLGLRRGLFPNSILHDDMPTGYSIELCRAVQSCLLYDPILRPTIETLLQTAEQNLARLDKVHRGEFGTSAENILDDFRPEVITDERNAPFAIGRQFQPMSKRRRLDEVEEHRAVYEDHVNNWNNLPKYRPRPDRDDMLTALDAIRQYINRAGGWRDAVSVRYLDDSDRAPSPRTLVWRHLYSTICKEIDPASDVYVSTNREAPNHNYAFTRQFKDDCLSDIIEHFLPNYLGNPGVAQFSSAFEALDHALSWGRWLLLYRGEPREPQLQDMTLIHRAILDWCLLPEPGIDLPGLQNDEGELINYVPEGSSDGGFGGGASDDEFGEGASDGEFDGGASAGGLGEGAFDDEFGEIPFDGEGEEDEIGF